MELFLAQNHGPATHLPIATSFLAALAAVIAVFSRKKEWSWVWALLTIVAFVAVIPTLVTGIEAARGRQFIDQGFIVSNTPDDAVIRLHQIFGITGAVIALIACGFAIARLRGRFFNRFLIAGIAVILSIVWAYGGHLGGKDIWGPDTFPAFDKQHQSQPHG